MATTNDSFNGMTEHCDACELETLHEVSVQIRTESLKKENAQFSREPYRVRECQRCGNRSSQRMNNA
ncbi:hypothetical protein CP556_04575 [Natrinema sp. CBA1119]|jgi:hypothetical protein|uniref:DUF7835 family putative zinc beta-ribbon protein n=1 Tax=unclassified Natrinema TaxID=2622230 RepID=UPI000BF50E2F|nr:hypothetical protein [Natrinema sp. CBA1119]PGF15474.1 hypothetical protein CP556_04575 [Natrinema sp. CBA1119]